MNVIDEEMVRLGLGERAAGSTLIRFKIVDGSGLLLVIHEGREYVYPVSVDVLSILMQDVARACFSGSPRT